MNDDNISPSNIYGYIIMAITELALLTIGQIDYAKKVLL